MNWKGLGIGILIAVVVAIIFELYGNILGPITFIAVAILPGLLGGVAARYFVKDISMITILLIGIISAIFVILFFIYLDDKGLIYSSSSGDGSSLMDGIVIIFIGIISWFNIPFAFLGKWIEGKMSNRTK
jgi:hypothetical protein